MGVRGVNAGLEKSSIYVNVTGRVEAVLAGVFVVGLAPPPYIYSTILGSFWGLFGVFRGFWGYFRGFPKIWGLFRRFWGFFEVLGGFQGFGSKVTNWSKSAFFGVFWSNL